MANHWHSNRTQIFWTCKALIQGRVIVDGWRLGAITHDLRSQYSWPIQTEYRGAENIAHYFLPDGCKWRLLDFPLSAQMLKDEMPGEHQDVMRATERLTRGQDGSAHG